MTQDLSSPRLRYSYSYLSHILFYPFHIYIYIYVRSRAHIQSNPVDSVRVSVAMELDPFSSYPSYPILHHDTDPP